MSCKSVSTQCDLLSAPLLTRLSDCPLEDEAEMECETLTKDDEYIPTEEEEEEYQIECGVGSSPPVLDIQPSVHGEKKYLVFESSLLQLLQWCHCPDCGSLEVSSSAPKMLINGSLLSLTIVCKSCGRGSTWRSQPNVSQIPAGNILMSAAILFAGATPTKILRVFRHMGLTSISDRTFHRHQTKFLQPAVQSVWKDQQTKLIDECKESGPLSLGGDGRADSPGHSAKFGTYTLVELSRNKIVDIQLVQVISKNKSSSVCILGVFHMFSFFCR